MRLCLGSCDNLMPAPWINVDRYDFSRPGYEFQQVDLNREWPWPDSSVDELRMHDIAEHLWPTITVRVQTLPRLETVDLDIWRTDVNPKTWVMNQSHRVLRPGGVLSLIVPTTEGRGDQQDPQHCTSWNCNSVFYFSDHHPEWRRFRQANGTTACFRVKGIDRDDRGGAIEAVEHGIPGLFPGHHKVANEVWKLHVILECVK